MHSAHTIIPELQHPAVGNVQHLGNHGNHGPILHTEILEPDHPLVLHSKDGARVWAFGLYPSGNATQRAERLAQDRHSPYRRSA